MRSLSRKPFRKPPHTRTNDAGMEVERRRREAMEGFADRILAADNKRKQRGRPRPTGERTPANGKPLNPRLCPVCGRVFTPRRADTTCCSLLCFMRGPAVPATPKESGP
jgi:hypothetical protein